MDDKEKEYKAHEVEPQNPPKYELMEDMANMTYLSEAAVVNNLNQRYQRFLIYTYSGKSSVTLENTYNDLGRESLRKVKFMMLIISKSFQYLIWNKPLISF